MNATTVIPTDLVTPLGAYLRLRPEEGASFLLESVEHGRLGRHSFVGHGRRIVGFEEAEALDEPLVGFLGYDHVARLEPTVPLPDTGPEATVFASGRSRNLLRRLSDSRKPPRPDVR